MTMTIDHIEVTDDGIVTVRWLKPDGTFHRTSYEPGDELPAEVQAAVAAHE